MIIFKNPADIHSFLSAKKNEGLTTAFVPTMGALHNGHISLINKARNETQLVTCSIFVNPTQFNDAKDFEHYPSTLEKDILLLEKAGCDVLFLPSVAGIYPDGTQPTKQYELGPVEDILEGKFRPGHFQGVCQVMHRLLSIVLPAKLFIGQKDFQQCMVLKKLVALEGFKTQVIVCQTHRNTDGLAMSSRNLRLNEAERAKAPAIYEALLSIKKELKAGDMVQPAEKARQLLVANGFKVDYVEIAALDTLVIIQKWDGQSSIIALAAAYLNDIRLIDNLILNETPKPSKEKA